MDDVIEIKRLKSPKRGGKCRPADLPAPLSTDDFVAREAYALKFVPWFLELTGGDPEIEGVPAGHRWRMEYFDCVADPVAFRERAMREIDLFVAGEKR